MRGKIEKEPVECTSIFVEPMKWMETGDLFILSFVAIYYVHKMLVLSSILSWPVQEGYVQERLHCMGCKGRLGYFNWAGMQCSCGAWVNLAFQLHKSRLDECHI
jgi:dual specificity phosphatase 12